MNDNSKPEWIQIAESDGPLQPVKARRSLPVTTTLALALVFGAGTVVAQTQEETPAQATETTSAAINNPSSVNPKTTSTAVMTPKIATLPSGGEQEGRDESGVRTANAHASNDDFEGEDD